MNDPDGDTAQYEIKSDTGAASSEAAPVRLLQKRESRALANASAGRPR